MPTKSHARERRGYDGDFRVARLGAFCFLLFYNLFRLRGYAWFLDELSEWFVCTYVPTLINDDGTYMTDDIPYLLYCTKKKKQFLTSVLK